jgi:hypothetical protein
VRLVLTMMIRDEVDIVVPMIEHHVDQGIDLLIVTDNGSVDGTTEILERYAAAGIVELHHDPVHRMQQGALVTGMARRACTEHGADWVINADADEFLVPLDRSLTVREVLERTPMALQAFTVPVTNLVGSPAQRGAGVDRLVWRDCRTDEALQAIGIYAQPTANAIHIGDPQIKVSEGNHFVSLDSRGQPDPAVSMEVLHLPWRSWSQFETKVINAGRAYEANTDLQPSPKHHGMADYRRAQAGWLHEALHLRLPQASDLTEGACFVEDVWLCRHLHDLVPRAIFPDLLEEALDDGKDQPYSALESAALVRAGQKFLAIEGELDTHRHRADELRDTISSLQGDVDAQHVVVDELRSTITSLQRDLDAHRARGDELHSAVSRLRNRTRRLRQERDQARLEAAGVRAEKRVGSGLARVRRRLVGALRRFKQ